MAPAPDAAEWELPRLRTSFVFQVCEIVVVTTTGLKMMSLAER
jgi:hypothetical protein